MSGKYTQQTRHLLVSTPLGKDVLLLKSFTGHEGISQLFQFNLDVASEQEDLPMQDLLGKNITFAVRFPDAEKLRHFNGYVSKFSQTGREGDFVTYKLEVVPWLWFLTKTTDCRIFQNKTVPQMVETIFQDLGFSDFENQLSGSYQPWEYCVQYRETAYAFVCRMMEQEGIYFYFKHDNGKHTLVMGDSPAAHSALAETPSLKFNRHGGGESPDPHTVSEWNRTIEVRSGKLALNDYFFETPNSSLLSAVDSQFQVGGNAALELYDYPGEYEKSSQGETYARLRMEEEEVGHDLIDGAGNALMMSPGFRFDLTDHPRAKENDSYVITQMSHSGQSDAVFGDTGGGQAYTNSFTCIPLSVPFRPARQTPKPTIRGTQTALVVGPSGEEIWTDKYGRVKLHFFWDRRSKKDENSSCWVRVSQTWAGKGWGAMNIPRIGQEVIVDFLEGDPDRPIVVGRVYNAGQAVPYPLPAEQTRSGIKTSSSKGGSGFNEIRFEDKAGSEQVFVHAQKDMDVRVLNDTKEWVGANKHLKVAADQMDEVGGDKHVTVKGDYNDKIIGTFSQKADSDIQLKAGMKYGLDAGQEVHIKGGMNVVVEAGMMVTLKAAGSFITVGPAGVAISGPMVLINSGGSAGSGSGSSPAAAKPPADADDAKAGAVEAPSPDDFSMSTFEESVQTLEFVPAPVPETPAAVVLQQANAVAAPFCEVCTPEPVTVTKTPAATGLAAMIDQARNKAKSMLAAARQGVQKASAGVQDLINQGNAAAAAAAKKASDLAQAAAAEVKSIASKASEMATQAVQKAADAVKGVTAQAREVVNKAAEEASQAVQKVADLVTKAADKAEEVATQTAQAAANTIKAAASSASEAVGNIARQAASEAQNAAAQVQQAAAQAREAAVEAVQAAEEAINARISEGEAFANDKIRQGESAFNDLVTRGENAANPAIQKGEGALSGAISQGQSALEGLADKGEAALNAAIGKVESAATSAVNNAASKLGPAAQAALQKVANTAQKAAGAAQKGASRIQKVADFAGKAASKAQNAASKAADTLQQVSDGLGEISSLGGSDSNPRLN
jgi:type VI secretion system secreted protein VgrG